MWEAVPLMAARAGRDTAVQRSLGLPDGLASLSVNMLSAYVLFLKIEVDGNSDISERVRRLCTLHNSLMKV